MTQNKLAKDNNQNQPRRKSQQSLRQESKHPNDSATSSMRANRVLSQSGRRPMPHEIQALQQTIGNHSVQRILDSHQDAGQSVFSPAEMNLHHQGIRLHKTSGQNGTIQRKKKKPVSESIGGDQGNITFLEKPGGPTGETVGLGEEGFSLAMLSGENKSGAGTLANLGNYKNAHLTTVASPDFTKLDKQIKTRAKQMEQALGDKKGRTIWGEPSPFFQNMYEGQRQAAEQHLQVITGHRPMEQNRVKQYNSWVPRANAMFVSLARLESFQDTLGVSSPEQMVSSLAESLKEAQGIAERSGVTNFTTPKGDASVKSAAENTTLRFSEMKTAWLGVKATMVKKRAKEIEAAGDDDKKRLEQINKNIETWGKIGKTIDVSLAVMSGGSKAIAGGSAAGVVGGEVQVVDTSSDLAKSFAKDSASALGIPTSVEGLAKGIASLVYAEEIQQIESTLRQLKSMADAERTVAEHMLTAKALEEFGNAVKAYKKASADEQKVVRQRQLDYLKLGKELDAAAQADKEARASGTAPGKGKERFATVLLLVSAIREVLTRATGATSGLGMTPGVILSTLQNIEVERRESIERFGSVGGMSVAEATPLVSMYKQSKAFFDNAALLQNTFQQVEAQANQLMQVLNANAEGSGEY
ncbi:MAG: hypothetical protein ACE5E7_16155 [Anaerolineae bacterium]